MTIEEIYNIYKTNFLVDTDTRKIKKNSLFFALKGENFNGNKFAERALELGAKYAIIDEAEYKIDDRFILVDNVLKCLQELANYHRNKLHIPIIGLTGSNGKTTTKELINIVLKQKFKTVATLGNLNNHIGVPLTLLSIDDSAEIGIVEMGANHQKEIEFLSSICEPDFGYITNFGKAHLEGFGGVEGVIKGKSELYDYLKNNNKIAFVNPDDAIQMEKTADINRVFFNENIHFIDANPKVKLLLNQKEINSNLIGKYNYNNIAIAVTIGKYFDISEEKIIDSIESYTSTNNRSQVIKKNKNTIILDAYNANPSSMKVALESFISMKTQGKIVILGDMFELGECSLEEHQKIVDLVNSSPFESAFFVGENFYQTTSNTNKFYSYEDLKLHLKNLEITNKTFLIKGSRGMQLERVLNIIE